MQQSTFLKKGRNIWEIISMPRPFDGASGDTSRFDFAHRRRLGIDPSTLLRVNTERSRSVNGTVGQTETDPNA